MSLFKKIFSDTMIYGGSMLLARAATLFSLPLLTHEFSPATYALIALLFIITPIVRFLIPLEISQATSLFFVDAETTSQKKNIFSTGFHFTTITCTCFLAVALLLTQITPLGEKLQIHLLSHTSLILICAGLLLDALCYYCLNIIRWEGHAKYYAFISILLAWSYIFSLLICLKSRHMGLNGVFLSFFISNATAFGFAWYKTRKYLACTISRKPLGQMLKFSLPLLLSNIPNHLNKLFDRFIVQFLLGMAAMGIYSATLTLAAPATFIPIILELAIWPTLYKTCQEKTKQADIARLLNLTYFGLMTLGCCLIMISKPFLYLMVSDQYQAYPHIDTLAAVLMIAPLPDALHTFFPGIAIKRKSVYYLLGTLIALATNILFSLLFIPIFGIVGVGLALIGSALCQLACIVCFSQKCLHLPFQLKKLTLIAIPCALVYSGLIHLNHILPANTLTAIMERAGISLLFVMAFFIYAGISLKQSNHTAYYVPMVSQGGDLKK